MLERVHWRWSSRTRRPGRGPILCLRNGEHAIAVCALRCWHLFPHDIPMLGDPAIGDAQNIDSHHRFGTPSEIAAVNGDIVAVRHYETRLILEVSREFCQERLDRGDAAWDLRVVLQIVMAEQAIENGGVPIHENPLNPPQEPGLCCRRHSGKS